MYIVAIYSLHEISLMFCIEYLTILSIRKSSAWLYSKTTPLACLEAVVLSIDQYIR